MTQSTRHRLFVCTSTLHTAYCGICIFNLSLPAQPHCKIVCSLRPSTDLQTMKHLLWSGMNVARVWCGWGSPKELEALIQRIREASASTKRLCAIILETHGAAAMIGPLSTDPSTSPSSTVPDIDSNVHSNADSNARSNIKSLTISSPTTLSSPTTSKVSDDALQSLATTLNLNVADLPRDLIENAAFAMEHVMGNDVENENESIERAQSESARIEIIDGDESTTHSPSSTVQLVDGGKVRIFTERVVMGNAQEFTVIFPGLIHRVSVGQNVEIGSGAQTVSLQIESVERRQRMICCLVLNGGRIWERSTVRFPSLKRSGMTQQEVADIGFAVQQNVDYVMTSQIESAEDVNVCTFWLSLSQ